MFASFAANAYNMQGNQGVIHSIHMVHMGCCSVGQYLAAYNPNALQSYLSAEQFAQEIRALNAIWAKHLSQAKSVGIAAIVCIVLGFVTFAMTGVVIASADMGFPITVPIGMVIFITGMGLAAFSNVSRRNACARAFIEIQTYCGQKSGAYNGLQWNVQQNMMVIGRRQAQMVPVINLCLPQGAAGPPQGMQQQFQQPVANPYGNAYQGMAMPVAQAGPAMPVVAQAQAQPQAAAPVATAVAYQPPAGQQVPMASEVPKV